MKKIFLLATYLLLVYTVCFPQNNPSGYSEAMEAFHNKQYAKSYELFNQFINQYRGTDDILSSTAKYYSAESLLRLNQIDASISAFEYFVNNYKGSNFRNDALYKLGTIYFDRREFENSRQKLSTLLEDYPESDNAGSALYFIAISYSEQGRFDEAIKYFQEAISSKKNNKYVDNSIYTLALIYEKKGEYKNAVAYYDSLLAYYKSSTLAPSAQIRIGLCYFELKAYDNAVLELNDPLITGLPEEQQMEAKYILANSYYRLKEFKEAETSFRDVIKQGAKASLNRPARYGLGWVNFQQGKFDEAFKVFSSLSRTGNDTIAVNSLFWSAEAKRYDGNEKEATVIYEDFLNSYPDNKLATRVKYEMGVVSFSENNSAASEELLLASTQSGDISVRGKAFTVLGELKLNKKDFKAAKENFGKALSETELKPELKNRADLGLAVSEYYLNEYDDAVRRLNDIVRRAGNFEKNKVRFYLAECYFAQKEYSKALKNYNDIDSDSKEFAGQVSYGKGYAYYNLKDFKNASYYLADFVKKNRNSTFYQDARLRLADSYYGEKKFADASRIYKEVFLSGNPDFSGDYAYYQYAQALYKAGNANEAIKEFAQLQEKFPDSKYVAESQYVIGWIMFQKGNFKDAITNYNHLIYKYPSSPVVPVAYNSIGNSYFNLGKYDSAIVYYEKVLSGYSQSSNAFDAISGINDAYMAEGRPEEAIGVIDKYMGENRGAGYADQILFKKGEIYYSTRNYEKAKDSYKQFISSFPNSQFIPQAYFSLGKCAANLKQNEEALYNFNIVFNKYSGSETAIAAALEMGRIHTSLKNFDSAIHIYSSAIDKLPPESDKIPELMNERASAYVAKGDVTKAYDDYNFLIQYYNSSVFAANAKFEIGLIELARNNFQTCDMLFKELSESRTDELGAKAQYYLGESLFRQNKISDAITALVRVKFAFGNYELWLTESYLKLGECYAKIDETEKAKEMYRIVIQHHKGDKYGEEAQN
ncbi:MAG: tetratricopeptide repeat protein, partial [Methanococcaceae archaeon]